jgi:ABC-type dipeptide/oligopeptide/nickel transport system permease component
MVEDGLGMPWKYVFRRLAIALVQLAAISVGVFFLMRALPADPVGHLVGFDASPEAIAHTRHFLYLDRSQLDQLAIYLGLNTDNGPGLIEGNLGTSWTTGAHIAEDIRTYLPITLELITYSFLVAILVAVPIGLLAALKPRGLLSRVAFVFSLFAGAQPEFWWGLTFIFLFYVKLHIAPAPLGILNPLAQAPPTITGMVTIDSLLSGNFSTFFEAASHLMLPVLTLAFVLSGPIIKMVRQNVLKTLQSDYMMYARSLGLSQFRIATYTLKNSLAPCLTLIGILYGYMLGGAVLIEQVFSLGGLGQYAVRSVLSFDFPAIQGIVLVTTTGSLLILLSIDVVHALIDPRIAR